VSWHHALPVGDEDCYEACRHVLTSLFLRDPAKKYHVRDGTCGCFDQSGTHGKHGEFATRGDRAANDKAVLWMYAGQLRFRFLLMTEPKADPSGDPALSASLQETIGTPINAYVGADTDKWVSQISATAATQRSTDFTASCIAGKPA